jgi:hypothetical protein
MPPHVEPFREYGRSAQLEKIEELRPTSSWHKVLDRRGDGTSASVTLSIATADHFEATPRELLTEREEST